MTGRAIHVKGIGACSSDINSFGCTSAFRPQSDLIAVRMWEDFRCSSKMTTEGPTYLASYSPFPADLNINPLYRLFSRNTGRVSSLEFETSEPLAHSQQDFEIDNVFLKDFAASGDID